MNVTATRFVRRTTLQGDEYRKNFRQIDRDVIELLKSAEAKRVTRLMAALYLTLIDAPSEYWEREGVLRFTGELREGKPWTAWQQLVDLLDCGNSTAKKALEWMHQQGIIGYFAGKNGVGIRIFINRAAASIGKRVDQKNLHLVRTPAFESRTPTIGTPFKVDSLEIEDPNKEFPAPKNGADIQAVNKTSTDSAPTIDPQFSVLPQHGGRELASALSHSDMISVDEIVERLKSKLEPCMKVTAMHAASQAAAREIAHTRQWFETKALPKAVRVAQHETYDLFRKLGTLNAQKERVRADLQVGRAAGDYAPPAAKPLTPGEITEVAELCVALLEAQGKTVDETLSEIGSEGGGWLLPEDAPKVCAEIERLLCARSDRR